MEKNDDYYKQVEQEIKEGKYQEGLRTRSIAEADGNESKARALYIKFRIESLKAEEAKTIRKAKEEKKRERLAERPTLSTAVIWFSLQFVLALILHLFDLDKGGYGQNWTGIMMGWVCLIYGFKYASLISQNISKRASHIYRSFGVVLLFIGGLPGGWILALLHQIYAFKHGQSAKEYAKFMAIIIILMIAIYFGGGLLYELITQK
jgi:hypothetical protein